MNYRSMFDLPEIPWPDWETRYTSTGPVRSIPLDQASPAPIEAQAPVPHFLPSQRAERPEGAEETGHIGKAPLRPNKPTYGRNGKTRGRPIGGSFAFRPCSKDGGKHDFSATYGCNQRRCVKCDRRANNCILGDQ